MKALFLLIVLLFSTVSATTQETVNVKFTASTENGHYCPFTSVSVTNMSKGWSLDLEYPDTVLMLGNTVGIDVANYSNKNFSLGGAYPNPFADATYSLLDISEESEVLLMALAIDGATIAAKQTRLTPGTYRVKLSLSAPQSALLLVTAGSQCQSVNVVHKDCGTKNSIDIEFVSKLHRKDLESLGDFESGDIMSYEARLIDEGNMINSALITQPQFDDETVTLLFDLDLPTVTTSEVDEITWNSAIVVGEVSDDGNAIIKERGVCWSTSREPTIEGGHASDGGGTGPFRINLTGLDENTTYYVRSYAVNCIGTDYGNEIAFATTELPHYAVNATTIPYNSGFVVGGGDYQLGQSCTLMAVANEGWSFVNWTENGDTISTDSCITFNVSENHNYVAHFWPTYSFYEGQGLNYSHFFGGTVTDSVYSRFDSLMVNYPDFVTKQCIGMACDSQALFCYEFVREENINKPKIIIICSQHGFEKNSTFGMYYFLKDVAESNGQVPFLQYVHDELHLMVVPVTNPSGFNVSTYRNANGVNLNRNWPVVNWTGNNDPSSSNYSGVAPLDQPETRCVDSLVNMNLDAKLFIDFHTNGGGVLDTARKVNWLSFPRIEDTVAKRMILQAANEHLDSITTNFRRLYGEGRPCLYNTPRLGYITMAQSWGTTGYADVSMSQGGCWL